MKTGDIVRNKKTGTYGTVEYSTFGFSIHAWEEYDNRLVFGKTLGCPAHRLLENWELVDMPNGYHVHEYGGLVKEDQHG